VGYGCLITAQLTCFVFPSVRWPYYRAFGTAFFLRDLLHLLINPIGLLPVIRVNFAAPLALAHFGPMVPVKSGSVFESFNVYIENV